MLWDMHVHLDFMRDPGQIAADAEALDLGLFAVTVTPDGFLRIRESFPDRQNVYLGVGLHPWWIADGRCNREDVLRAADIARKNRFIGEIGLDASPKHVPEGSLEIQAEAFETICAACAESAEASQPKNLSLHSVKAAGLTLDILERTGCLERCRCIFHWFTGSNEELTRALKAGCMFSINEMMLNTRRGREYARQIPENRLLLETDLPPGEHVPFSAAEILASLERTLDRLNLIRGAGMRSAVCRNSRILLS